MEKAGEAEEEARREGLKAGGSRVQTELGLPVEMDETLVPGGCDRTGPGRVADQTPFQPGTRESRELRPRLHSWGEGLSPPFS